MTESEAEFFQPRGLEAAVPALADLRRQWWPALPPRLQLLLEVADYVGLRRAVCLDAEGLNCAWGTLPGALWYRCLEYVCDGDSLGDSLDANPIVAIVGRL